MTSSVVTNISDLTPAMREALLRPAAPDQPTRVPDTATRATIAALANRGLVVIVAGNPLAYRLTDAGARARSALAPSGAPIVVNQALGSYGWAMLAESDFGGHSITTWTRDGHTLVLSWTGAYEVSAAIYDGLPLPLDQLVQTVLNDHEVYDSLEHLLDMAARQAMLVAPARFATRLSDLLTTLAGQSSAGHVSPAVRLAAGQLASALLATPHAR